MTTKYIRAQTFGSTTGFVPLLNIPDGHGELKSLGVANGLRYHYVRVTIDGAVLAEERLAGTAFANGRCQASLPIGLRFEDSLLVEVRSDTDAPQTTYWVVAQTDSSEFVRSEHFTSGFDSIDLVFERSTYRRPNGSTYDVIVAIGPERISELSLNLDVYQRDELLEGTVRLRTATGQPLYAEFVPIVVRISGTQRPFPIRGRGREIDRSNNQSFGVANVEGTRGFGIPVGAIADSLNLQLPVVIGVGPQFELVAQLQGFSNVPTGLQLI